MRHSFSVRTERAGDALVILTTGELDIAAVPDQAAALREALDAGPALILSDLSGVDFLDSSGLKSLLDARRICADAGIGFALRAPSEAVLRVLRLVDLLDRFTVVPDGAVALPESAA